MPALVEAEPAQTLFAEETYQFALRFDEAVTIVSQDALRFASNGVELPGLAAGATVSSEGHVIRFEYTVPSEAARTVLAVTLRGEAVRDDMQRALPSDVTFTRRVESPCGPAYLAALAANTEAEAGVCRCRRSSARCECQCGKLGASMEF